MTAPARHIGHQAPHLAGTPVLETERLILRAPGPQDWEAFADFVLSERAHFIRPADYTRTNAWRGFGHAIGHWALRGFGSFVFCAKGSDVALGMTGPWFPEGWPEREIGWTVWSPAAEGKGLAFEAAAAARDHAFHDLGWDTAVSYIHPANARSIALAERLGATRDDAAATPGTDTAGTRLDQGSPDAAATPDTDPCLVYRHPAPGAV